MEILGYSALILFGIALTGVWLLIAFNYVGRYTIGGAFNGIRVRLAVAICGLLFAHRPVAAHVQAGVSLVCWPSRPTILILAIAFAPAPVPGWRFLLCIMFSSFISRRWVVLRGHRLLCVDPREKAVLIQVHAPPNADDRALCLKTIARRGEDVPTELSLCERWVLIGELFDRRQVAGHCL